MKIVKSGGFKIMPILRAQKVDLVAKLTEELQNSRVALVFAYTGLNMSANDKLRTAAFEAGAKIKMISNNLLRLILKNTKRELEIPEKTLALAYGFEDEVVAAKTLVEFAKETETLEVLGGWIDGNFFDASQIKTLSALPNKETLQAQLVGRLNGIIAGLAYSLNFPIQKLAFVVEAVKNAQPAAEVKVEEKPVAEDPKAEEPSESAETPTEESKEETKTEEVEVSDLSDGALAKSEEVKEEDK
ncbi:50S ribosomal protein L10 [Candidatus Berkelbacteria bacterium RIFCSPLOWO2_01_FULL_50_28]|uniref:Large ribosomal subunit protein uL10 n=1 Tax=Candidatus Berkelbacteria bacterium RIFCSPLOWO2_01_FULL_50_28 TaxID=1797471 RepID=A0A1F5EBU0_9BACT|nr:MAG: 50S ribosomal protein L10 [Candidatus Berkelbacteria bacterium RIFCSPHIGHO2_01_FULL_50_36]OGD63225.1 MAG: 50S ribosomal protein L10 [Candidatus Berkelbacteria bacterium RIFCSPHIGHO2_12_FULL_50_11]OGD64811.1 MAG: 50S ribosomal protein L10 [Candidatus Berkelbacteria bacterium RIFCSPLOWO2_01_FULL_50_28]